MTLERAWTAHQICADICDVTGLGAACVRPVMEGHLLATATCRRTMDSADDQSALRRHFVRQSTSTGQTLVIEMRAAKHVTLLHVYRAALLLLSHAKELTLSGTRVCPLEQHSRASQARSTLEYACGLSMVVSAAPPASMAECPCAALLSWAPPHLHNERHAARHIVLPAIRGLLGADGGLRSGVPFAWIDPCDLPHSPSLAGHEFVADSPRAGLARRMQNACRVRRAVGAPLFMVHCDVGNAQAPKWGTEIAPPYIEHIVLRRQAGFMRLSAWNDVAMTWPASYVAYTSSAGTNPAEGEDKDEGAAADAYTTSFLGCVPSCYEAANAHAKRCEASQYPPLLLFCMCVSVHAHAYATSPGMPCIF
jgi:hypothetical protein